MRAFELKAQGWKQIVIAKALGVTRGAVSQWLKVIKEFLTDGGAKRIHLEQLPGYAPDLNPDEGIWRYLKRVELRNLCRSDLNELRRELRLAVGRLRHRRHIIRSCI